MHRGAIAFDQLIVIHPDQFCMAAQQFHTDRVESAQPRHAFDRLAQHPADPVLHFPRSLVGERHRQYFVGAGAAGVQKMYDPCGQCLGLAGTCTSQHQDRTVQLFHRLALRRVQLVQIGRGPRSHSARGQRSAFKGVIFVETAHERQSSVTEGRGKEMFRVCSGTSRILVQHRRIKFT